MVFRDGKALTHPSERGQHGKSHCAFFAADAKRYREVYQRFATEMGSLMTEFMYSVPLPPPELAKRVSGPQMR